MAGAGMTLDQAKAAVQDMMLRESPNPIVVHERAGSVSPTDLPIQSYAVEELGKTLVKHAVDVIADYATDLDVDSLTVLLAESKWSDLPEPLCPKMPLPDGIKLQMAVVQHPDAPGHYAVIKHFAAGLAQGTFHKIGWIHPKTGMKVWQYMFDHLGGLRVSNWYLEPFAARRKVGGETIMASLDDEAVDEGFDFIEREGPRSVSLNAQLRWITKQMNNAEGAIYKWPAALIKEALRNLANDGVLALRQAGWPLTIKEINPEIRTKVLLSVLPTLTTHGLILLGEPGGGKTPLARTIAMAMARKMKRDLALAGEPCFRSACDMDFFRGEPGTVLSPDLFDNGDSATQPMRKLKAFLDVGENEAMSRERWGASKFVKGQLSVLIDNSYSEAAEPDGDSDTVSHKAFYEMITVAFMPGQQAPHYMALFKRASIILNTKKWVYYRLPGELELPMARIPSGQVDYLTSEAKPIYGKFKGGDKEMPESFQDSLEWESKFVKHAFARAARQRGEDIVVPSLPWTIFGQRIPDETSAAANMMAFPEVSAEAADLREAVAASSTEGGGNANV